ncbi:MAG: hypothetical protein AAB686_03755 [Patescibacteria group bacterium]
MAPIVVIFLRLLVPIGILRWPFWGALLAIAADAADVILLDAFGWGFFAGQDYHAIDKLFDTYYLALEVYVAWSWRDILARNVSLTLFFWRLVGVIVFEVTRVRQVILFAPNIFENFYLIITGLKQFLPGFTVDSRKKLWVILAIAAIPKIAQEYIMHFMEFPTWAFIKHNIFRWR